MYWLFSYIRYFGQRYKTSHLTASILLLGSQTYYTSILSEHKSYGFLNMFLLKNAAGVNKRPFQREHINTAPSKLESRVSGRVCLPV